MEPQKKEIRCSVCLNEFTQIEADPRLLACCPVCGTKVKPQRIEFDVDTRINWDDLRMLATYSMMWMIRVKKNPIKGNERINKDAERALDNALVRIATFKPKDGQSLIDRRIVSILKNGEPMNGEKKEEGVPSPYYFGQGGKL